MPSKPSLPHICRCEEFACGSGSFELDGVRYTGKSRSRQNGAIHEAELRRLRIKRAQGIVQQPSHTSNDERLSSSSTQPRQESQVSTSTNFNALNALQQLI